MLGAPNKKPPAQGRRHQIKKDKRELLRFADNTLSVFVACDIARDVGRRRYFQQWVVDIALPHVCSTRLIRSLFALGNSFWRSIRTGGMKVHLQNSYCDNS